ncbi:TMEM43 family protein [Oharaeibacter diazotrophicus]|uniref:Uncharacterized protein DUF1625 n=1 Tax=Oharaeibacter diazotrophicus TaxID=1920512 RepID=A0A4R6RDN4_9HYPH|nr:TMEM43 family protein [Oharaeibacter diazotrophicus]TDP84300.1 uncharacterized protein DUF1625 [Oharaeibacter diazotrophicus]BBE73337.1 hypothetical protein OHA_1_02947 [Pleomorphomonas sp. SM30]GLS75128.1 hypothetical protein GCM10007904_04630 [Oharaeibacter diazotrophicus]
MARDRFTEVTSVSWFGRLKRSVGGVVFGLLLLVVATIGLFWNEGRAVTTARSLAEGKGLVVSVDAGTIDRANEGRLVHVAAPVTLDGEVADDVFPVRAAAIRLVRRVEMYQWRQSSQSETRKTLGGGEETVTTYSYDKVWQEGRIDSSDFREPSGHDNPSLPVESRTVSAASARLGAFRIDEGVLDQVGSERPLAVDAARADDFAAALGDGRRARVVGGEVRIGTDPDRPAVGDLRIRFATVPPGPVSAIGRQTGDGLSAYQTESGDALLMAEDGTVAADVMFAHAESANTTLTWVIRLVGVLATWIGFALVLGPLSVVFDVIPFLGSLVGFGTGLVAAVLTAVTAPVVIAVAWFWYRPLVSLAVLAVAGLLVAFLMWRGRARAATAT